MCAQYTEETRVQNFTQQDIHTWVDLAYTAFVEE